MAETNFFEDQIQFKAGYYNNIPPSGPSIDNIDVAYEASNAVFTGLGQATSWRGIQPFSSNAPAYLQLVGDALGGLATGSAILYRGKSVWYIGTGSVYYSDLATPIDTASSTLKFKYSGTIYNAGLSGPSAPTAVLYVDGTGVPVTGTVSGSVSVKITRVRSVTGTESASSDQSATVSPSNGQIQLTFPALNTADHQDQWGIYVTKQTFGDIGPYYFYSYINDTDLDGSRRYFLNFKDADLFNNLAPRDIIVAPAATHLVSLGDVMLLVGTESGVAVLPSLPSQPEQYDLSLTWYLTPAEPVVRVDTRPADGTVYIWTKNSLQTVIETGDSNAPIITRAVWPNTGIIGQSAACLTESGAYAFSGRQGMVRTSGYADPDTTFALPVQSLVTNWNPEDVVVGHDPGSNSIVYCHQKTILAYNQANNLWSGPLDITDFLVTNNPDTRVVGAATYNGELYLSVGNGSSNSLYKYGVGVGTNWYLRTAHRSAGAYGWYKLIRGARLGANFNTEIPPQVTINSNNVKHITDGYQCTSVNGIINIQETFTVSSVVNNQPYVKFTIPSNTSTDKIRIIAGPCTTSDAVVAMTIATTGAFYVDIRANGSIDCNGQASLPNGTVGAGYSVKLQRIQSGSPWHVFVYDTTGVQTAEVSFTPPISILAGAVGVNITLNAPAGQTKSIKNLVISGSPDATSTLTIKENYGTIGAYTKNFSQTGPTVYPWNKINIKNAAVYQVEISGKGCDQRLFNINLFGLVRPVAR